ncbi:hypothetical protein [Streptomyces sp. NPDC050263]|uniref:hypothetical protein n=1 Tax=Streptomyces sp. NPDC050263 TaxID=3155037 RepID=UPI003448AC4A
MNDMLRQLRGVVSLLHEEGEAGDVVDWEAAVAELGLASFPADYRGFVTLLGAGSLEDSLFVSIPRPGEPSAPLTVGRLPSDAYDSMNEWQDSSLGSRPALVDMLVWGQQGGFKFPVGAGCR